ncbi:MAG: hypothetical protein HQK68_11325 [Desulfamplus sp.]|nr:hypothetical protein [Desulfamplus sp.]
MSKEADLLGMVERPISIVEQILNIDVVVNLVILDECFNRVDIILEQSYLNDPKQSNELSEFKIGGTVCFWIKKLKPFRVSDDNHTANRLINEILAFLLAYFLIFGYLSIHKKESHIPKIKAHYFSDLIRSLRYNSYSPQSLVLLFEGLSL